MSRDVSALILAGGKATRFGGIAKHEIVVEGQTIFARQVSVLAPRVAEILVSCAREVPGYRTVRDAFEGVGPLAGIAAGLSACTTSWLLVVAGDMPHVTRGLVDRLIEPTQRGEPPRRQDRQDQSSDRRLQSSELDAVGIRIGGLPEPLLCVLHTRTLPIVERRISSGAYKVSRLLTHDRLRVHWIDDIDPAALRNVNAPEDLGP